MKISALNTGIYAVSEAAFYTGMPHQRLYSWFGSGKLFSSDYSGTEIARSISFLDLIDVLVAGEFRKNGISMQYVRRAYNALKSHLDTNHPFCHKDFFTGSGEIYIKVNDVLSEVLSNQVFDETVIKEHLKTIDYDPDTLLARRWRIRGGVILDPEIAYGKPTLESTRIPTYVLAKSYYANGKDFDFVAGLFELTSRDVKEAVMFESDLGRLPEVA